MRRNQWLVVLAMVAAVVLLINAVASGGVLARGAFVLEAVLAIWLLVPHRAAA